VRAGLVVFLAFSTASFATAYGQLRCVRQPESRLVYRDADGQKRQAAEWACTGGAKKQAFDLLADANLGPLAFAKVDELAGRVNAKSRKSTLGHVLNGAAFVLPLVAVALNDQLSDLDRTALAGSPRVFQKAVELIAGYPDEFERTPEQDGFLTLYTLTADPAVNLIREAEPLAVDPPAVDPSIREAEPQQQRETSAERVNRWLRGLEREAARDQAALGAIAAYREPEGVQ